MRATSTIAAACLLAVSILAAGQAAATVVQDKSKSNPPVESGGHHIGPSVPPHVTYSQIGAIDAENRWFAQMFSFPWRMMSVMSTRRDNTPARPIPLSPVSGAVNR